MANYVLEEKDSFTVFGLGTELKSQFPKGEYLIVKGEGTTANEFSNQLAGIAFGQVLPELNHVAYVGGPNASVLMEQENGRVVGEMWIPVVRK